MRKAFFPLFVTAFIVLSCNYSCTPQDSDTVTEEETKEPEKPILDPGTYKFVASPFKDKWEAGDQIYVHGAYGPKAVTITLKASEISTDGKTASVYLDEVTQYFAAPDGLYAVYPAAAAKRDNESLMDYTTEITDFLTPVSAAYLQGDTFTFADASAILSFTVSGDYDTMAIGGENRPAINPKAFTIEYSTFEPNIYPAANDGFPFRYAPLENGALTMVFPGGVNFKGGYSIYFGKEDNWTAIYTVEAETKFKAGTKIELGDITSQLKPYDGPKPKMPMMGKMTKYAVNVEEFSGLCLSEDNSFLWAIDDNGKLAQIDLTNNVGDVLGTWSLGGDPEGVTLNPYTGDLIIGNEEPISVGVVKAPVSKGDKQTIVFKIKEAKGYGNSGLEGITYYKRDGDKDLVYCGTQTNANLFLCDMNAAVDKDKYTPLVKDPISLTGFPGVREIAGLSYDPLTDWLWIVDSEAHKIFVFTGDASRLLCSYALKSKSNEEGIVVDHSRNCVWVADDYGYPSYLYKYEFEGMYEAIIEAE